MLLLAPENKFSKDYLTARRRFLEAAVQAGAVVSQLPHHGKQQDQDLTTDIAWFGSCNPLQVLVVSSGIHGIEGFAGSAVQLAAIENLPVVPDNTALIMVHILNPFGMHNLRRTNAQNVDLNRNFHIDPKGFSQENPEYVEINDFLNPQYSPKFDGFWFKLLQLRRRFGTKTLTQAVAGGQHAFPKGLFYGGNTLEPESRAYVDWLKAKKFSETRKMLVIDIHTGLGEFGEQTLFHHSNQITAQELSRRIKLPVSLDGKGEKNYMYDHGGGSKDLYRYLFKQVELAFLTVEYGTYSPVKVLHALRSENQLYYYGANRLNHKVKKAFKETFCPYPDIWRKRVVIQGIELIHKAMSTLSGENDRLVL